jgi:hypothetical protein
MVKSMATEKRYTERKLTLDNAPRKIFQPLPSLKFHSKRLGKCRSKGENGFFFLKMRYPWKFCSINYCRITVSDHFY